MRKAGKIRKYGYVKVSSLALTSLPALLEEGEEVDIGTPEDAPWILKGFYGKDRHRGRAVRWTGPSAVLRLPRPAEGRGLEVKVVVYDLRPPGYGEPPLFRVNGKEISGDRVSTSSADEGVVEYQFSLDGEAFPLHEGGELEIVSRPWVPARVLGTGDERELGYLVDRVEWRAR
jgi:hypothetical protein